MFNNSSVVSNLIETAFGSIYIGWTGLTKIWIGLSSNASSSNDVVSISSSKSSISKSSKSISIIVTIEDSSALIPLAITVPASKTAPSSTFNSEMLGKVCTTPGRIVISCITSLNSLNSTIPSIWQYTSFTTSVPAVTKVPFSTIFKEESLLIWWTSSGINTILPAFVTIWLSSTSTSTYLISPEEVTEHSSSTNSATIMPFSTVVSIGALTIYFSPDFLTVHNCSFFVCSNVAFEGLKDAITIVISLPFTIFLIVFLPDLISSISKSSA